jgi:glycerol-3-phosphate dehydrogenase (NAD(P)+)
MTSGESVAVLGAGTWGITLATLLVAQLQRDRAHERLPHQTLPESLKVTADLGEAMQGAQTAVLVVPSHAVRELCRTLRAGGWLTPESKLVMASKGIEEDSCALMSEVIAEELSGVLDAAQRLCILSGPSHAEEVSKRIPTAVVAAAEDEEVAREIQALFMTDRFRVYTQTDVVGVELAASLKNVIAIAAGACAGLGFGDNALAALIARGLAEIMRLGKRRGARAETFAGLAGIGDLVVTAMSEHSRNRRFGKLMAAGRTPEEAQREVGMVVEGVRTARAAKAMAEREKIEVPITEAVVAVIDGKLPFDEAVDSLMLRDPKPEIYLRHEDLS